MKKVLVVDDSALMRKLLTGVLAEGGYEVMSARNGAEGVEMVVQWQPDVVTLDINMPEMDGLTALSLIMRARPTPVVMVSSLTEKGALATFEALALGAVDFIPKPGGTISLHVDDIKVMLLDKVRSASRAQMGGMKGGMKGAMAGGPRPSSARPQPQAAPRGRDLVVVGHGHVPVHWCCRRGGGPGDRPGPSLAAVAQEFGALAGLNTWMRLLAVSAT